MSNSQAGRQPSPPSKRVVLVIDDEVAVQEAVRDILETEGVDVWAAINGRSGVALYQEHQDEINLVLLDLSMPGLSGVETFHELRKINPAIRVIISSGYIEAKVTRDFTDESDVTFLQKPYNWMSLVTTVLGMMSYE